MSLNFFRSSLRVGLDIQSQHICLCKLRRKRHKMVLEQAEIRPLPPGAILEGKIHQAAEVRACIMELIAVTDTQHCATVIALPASAVISKKIQLVLGLDEQEREMEIASQLAYHFPGATEELCYDYVLSHTTSAMETVFLVAARHDQLASYFSVVKSAGLNIKIVEVDSYALLRAIQFSLGAAPTPQLLAVLDLQAIKSQFIVSYHNEIIFYQTFASIGIQTSCTTIKNLFHLCCNQYRQLKIDKIFLSGSVNYLSTIFSYIKRELKTAAIYYDPLSRFNLTSFHHRQLKPIASQLIIACGLALRGV